MLLLDFRYKHNFVYWIKIRGADTKMPTTKNTERQMGSVGDPIRPIRAPKSSHDASVHPILAVQRLENNFIKIMFKHELKNFSVENPYKLVH